MNSFISNFQPQTTDICRWWWSRKLAPIDAINSVLYVVRPTRIFFPRNMVRISVLGKLRMLQQNTNRAVPLDAVPEHRTERCSPRFRPGDRFCELSFWYLSPGREGEKCRPLDHRWQIPFIHSIRLINSSNFYIYTTRRSSYFLHVVHTSVCIFDNCACAIAETIISRFRAIIRLMLCSIRHLLVPTHKVDGIYAFAIAERKKKCLKAVWEGKANAVQTPMKQSIKTQTKNFLTK